jgi:Protein of unknown function (DUF1153)
VVVDAVRSGAITLGEACCRYALSVEEFLRWRQAIESHGLAGLRVTRLQIYRDTPPAGLPMRRLFQDLQSHSNFCVPVSHATVYIRSV